MARIALSDFVESFLQFIWRAEGAGEEETPLCPILLRGWVEKHEEVSAGCWSASHSSRQKEKCPRCFNRRRSSAAWKALSQGSLLFVTMQWSVIHGTFWIEPELQSHTHSRFLCFMAKPKPVFCFSKPLMSVKCPYRSMGNGPFKYDLFLPGKPPLFSQFLKSW